MNCHAVGSGGPTTGTNLSFVGFTHTPEWLDAWLKDPKAWKSNSVMPDPHLTEGARKNIVAYLATLKGQGWTEGRPKDGRALFNSVGCVGCHGHDGKGGFPNNNVAGGLVPPLDKVKDGYTKAELVKKISVGVPRPQKKDPAGPEPMLAMPAWGQVLKEEEIAAIADFLLANSKSSGDGF